MTSPAAGRPHFSRVDITEGELLMVAPTYDLGQGKVETRETI